MSKNREEYVGRWALCRQGKLGKVKYWAASIYHGNDLQGNPWQSSAPVWVSAEQSRLLDDITDKAWRYNDLCR